MPGTLSPCSTEKMLWHTEKRGIESPLKIQEPWRQLKNIESAEMVYNYTVVYLQEVELAAAQFTSKVPVFCMKII